MLPFSKFSNTLATKHLFFTTIIGTCLALVGCGAQPETTPDFSVISSPQVPILAQATPTPQPTNTPEPPPPATDAGTKDPTLFEISPITPEAVTPTPQPTEAPAEAAPPEPTPPPPTPTPTPLPEPTTPPRRTTPWGELGFGGGI